MVVILDYFELITFSRTLANWRFETLHGIWKTQNWGVKMDPLCGVRPELELAWILRKIPSDHEHPLRGCLALCEPVGDHPDVLSPF